MKLQIESYHELVALHKSLMSAKFDPDPYIPELQGSPFTSSLAFNVFDLLVETCRSDGNLHLANEWLDWQKADESRREFKLLIKKIDNDPWWQKANKNEREKYLKEFMSPLILEKHLVAQTVRGA